MKKLTILFLLETAKINNKGLCPLKCRITYNKKRKTFSNGIFINPEYWNRKKQKAFIPDGDEYINNQLSLIKQKINQAFLFLQINEKTFTLDDIYREYKGETKKSEYGVIEVYNIHSKRLKKLVGIDMKQVTYTKYLESGVHLKNFIKWKFKTSDILLKDLKSNLLEEYEFYLKTEKKFQQSTINKAIQRFRKVVKYAIANEYLNRDPFILYKAKKVKKKVVYLSLEELTKLEEKDFTDGMIQQIKNMFVFCCYSGLAFKEMINLKATDINKEFDGKLWITISRVKTSRSYKVPLLPKAQKIIEFFDNDDGDMIFPKISNPTFNVYLKDIAKIVGIKKRLTHHMARKTFATTVLLSNNISMEVVSKLLGHSKIQTTQDHYGEIIQKRISEEMKRLKFK